MRLLLRVGQREAALRQYEAYERLLRDELNIAPSPELLGFYECLQTGQGMDSFTG